MRWTTSQSLSLFDSVEQSLIECHGCMGGTLSIISTCFPALWLDFWQDCIMRLQGVLGVPSNWAFTFSIKSSYALVCESADLHRV